MSKIVFCNKDIKDVRYSGYTITKIYACGGELVYEYQRPTPSNPIARFKVGDEWLEIGDVGSDSAVTTAEVQTWISSSEFNTMTNLQFYENCSSVGVAAFSGCSIEAINGWGSVLSIGTSAFNNCTNLKNVYYNCNNCPMVIGNYAFANCSSLSSVTLTCQSIGKNAFSSCSNLQTVVLYDVKTIGSSAFINCDIKTASIPSTITNIGSYAFANNYNMEKIEFQSTTPPDINIHVFDNTNNCPIVVPYPYKSAYQQKYNWNVYSNRIKYNSEI